ncbi:MAG TPA: tail fiber domain-containing protein [Xanthobacteraceae bacterium]
MQYSKFHSATALIAFLLCLGLNQPAAAISDSENEALMQQCTIYASRAQKAAQYVTGLGCYPDSGTTSTDYTAHYNFCYQGFINGTMDWAFLKWEDDKRTAMTRSCGYCTGTNTPPGVTPFRKASEDRISNKNIYHCTNDHSRGGPDYSTLAWSDDPKDRFKACLQIFPGDPGTKATFGGRYMPIPPLSADVLEAALEEQLEGSCPAIYAHPEQVRNTCWNFSTKARMIGNWVYNYEGDACFKGQPLGWWKNGQYYDWCIRVYDRVGSDLNALTLEQANSEIENQKETMEAVVDACQAKHQKPIIDDMGNECTPEAHAAGTCVFTATAQVGVMNTRGYAPSPPPLSYNTGVGDITNLKPPPKIGAFTPRGDGTGGGVGANNAGAGGSGGPGPFSSGGLNPVQPGGSNGPYAPGAGGSGKGIQLGSGGPAVMPGAGGGSGGAGGGGISSAMGQPAGNKSSTFIPASPGTNTGSGSSSLGQPVNKPSKFIHAPAFPGNGTQNMPRLSLASPQPNSTNSGTVNSSRRNYRGFHGAYRGYRARAHRNTARRSASHGGMRHARRSDIRLKHDVALLGRLDNGLGLYRFSYNGSNNIYVGVMAQEVETIMPEAVVRGKDGYLRVYYDRLGLRLQTWRAWEAEGQKIPTLIRPSR